MTILFIEPNRRASTRLSPKLTLFVSPYGKLYLKLQIFLAQNQPFELPKRRPGPKKPKHGIPTSEWPNALRCVLDNEESLRKVADEYGVSHETVRRLLLAARKQEGKALGNVLMN